MISRNLIAASLSIRQQVSTTESRTLALHRALQILGEELSRYLVTFIIEWTACPVVGPVLLRIGEVG